MRFLTFLSLVSIMNWSPIVVITSDFVMGGLAPNSLVIHGCLSASWAVYR